LDEQRKHEFAGLIAVFRPTDAQKIQITKRAGRGTVSIAQFPSPANDETLAVRIDDADPGGADWYELSFHGEKAELLDLRIFNASLDRAGRRLRHDALDGRARGRQSSTPQSDRALEELCRTYWFPLYAYVRRRGHTKEDAEDLTQAFFARFLEKIILPA